MSQPQSPQGHGGCENVPRLDGTGEYQEGRFVVLYGLQAPILLLVENVVPGIIRVGNHIDAVGIFTQQPLRRDFDPAGLGEFRAGTDAAAHGNQAVLVHGTRRRSEEVSPSQVDHGPLLRFGAEGGHPLHDIPLAGDQIRRPAFCAGGSSQQGHRRPVIVDRFQGQHDAGDAQFIKGRRLLRLVCRQDHKIRLQRRRSGGVHAVTAGHRRQFLQRRRGAAIELPRRRTVFHTHDALRRPQGDQGRRGRIAGRNDALRRGRKGHFPTGPVRQDDGVRRFAAGRGRRFLLRAAARQKGRHQSRRAGQGEGAFFHRKFHRISLPSGRCQNPRGAGCAGPLSLLYPPPSLLSTTIQ